MTSTGIYCRPVCPARTAKPEIADSSVPPPPRLVPAHNPHGLRDTIEGYFAGDVKAIDSISVETAGTVFQRTIRKELRSIPTGSAICYGKLAEQIARPKAVRAVGLANGSDPIGIVAPCHRVIGSNGSLTGYGGALERKRWLLDHELKYAGQDR